MVAVAPGDVVPVLDEAHPGIVAVLLAGHILLAFKDDGIVVDLPVNAVFGESGKNVHFHTPVVTAEHAGIGVSKGDHGRVEDAVGGRDGVPLNNRVAVVTPHGLGVAFGLVLPRHVGQSRSSKYLCHSTNSFLTIKF